MFPNKTLVGLHMRADGGNADADFAAFSVARCEAVKWMTTHPIEDVQRMRREHPSVFHLCRLYENLNGRIVTPEQFVNWQIAPDTAMRRMYANGVRHFETHNEPNLLQEGMWQSWRDGRQFGEWFLEVTRRLRLAFPDALFGYPGLSPGGYITGVRYDATQFWNESKFALEAADFISAHCYEVYNTTDRNAGGAWRIPRDLVPRKPLAITEFSSPLQNRETQARQYRQFYEKMRNERNVFAAFSFVVSGTHFEHEGWRLENGQLTPIPYEVAKRNFSPMPPDPILPPLPAEPLYVSRIDRNGANVRDFSGKFFKYLPPNTELPVWSEPMTIGGWKNRVIINKQTGYNVSAARLPRPVDAIFAWPTDYRVVTQRYGENPHKYGYGAAGHEGIDLRAPTGTNIYACHAGVVSYVRHAGAYGLHILIRLDDTPVVFGRLATLYAHLNQALVKAGDKVSAGQLIGKADSTGNTRGAHLHLNVYVNGARVDPAPYLGV